MSKIVNCLAVLLMMVASLPAQDQQPKSAETANKGEQEVIDFLVENKIKLQEGDRVLKGVLFTIVPTSKRVVIKTGEEAKTLVLGLHDTLKVQDGIKRIKPADLKRGDELILILGGENLFVREIYRFR